MYRVYTTLDHSQHCQRSHLVRSSYGYCLVIGVRAHMFIWLAILIVWFAHTLVYVRCMAILSLYVFVCLEACPELFGLRCFGSPMVLFSVSTISKRCPSDYEYQETFKVYYLSQH
jgi:hypothetical protein